VPKYKREKIEGKSDFRIKRALENKNEIYILEKNRDKWIYHHVKNLYTLQKLGFSAKSITRENSECFSLKDERYIIGTGIKIINLKYTTEYLVNLFRRNN